MWEVKRLLRWVMFVITAVCIIYQISCQVLLREPATSGYSIYWADHIQLCPAAVCVCTWCSSMQSIASCKSTTVIGGVSSAPDVRTWYEELLSWFPLEVWLPPSVLVISIAVRAAKNYRSTPRPLLTVLLTHHIFYYGCGFCACVLHLSAQLEWTISF